MFSDFFFNLLSPSSVLLFFLPPEVNDNKPEMDGWGEDMSPPTFSPGVTNSLSPQLLHDTKPNLLSSSSVLLFLYHLMSVIEKPGEGRRPLTFSPGGSINAFIFSTT